MIIDLDFYELFYLLDNCIRGSHLRATTIERFVNEVYGKLTEDERARLFELVVRLSYSWSDKKCFIPSSSCCGKDVIFMKRYHPLNQYTVKDSKGKEYRTFKMDDKYYVTSTTYINPEFIVSVERLELGDVWDKIRMDYVDYDTNIIS